MCNSANPPGATTADKFVVASVAQEDVVPFAAGQRIISRTASDRVGFAVEPHIEANGPCVELVIASIPVEGEPPREVDDDWSVR